MSQRISTILNRAADEMEKRGKARDSFINRQGNVCAFGAIRIACGGVVRHEAGKYSIGTAYMLPSLYDEATRFLDNYLAENNKSYRRSLDLAYGVPQWNDRSNKQTVVKALRDAAKAATELSE